MKFLKTISFLLSVFLLSSCIGSMNPTGGNSSPDYPYYITKKPMVVKKVAVPKGTKLVYEETFFKEGEQEKIMSENELHTIELPEGQPILWGGVPVTMIYKFFNSEMSGFSVYADFESLPEDKRTKFSAMWESCSEDIGITVKNTSDWSFNKNNIADVESCSVIYQRYFKDDIEQQTFLNTMYAELLKVENR